MNDENIWFNDYKSKQGNIGLGQAIAHYMAKGYAVSLPINDTQPYDLIVDKFDGNGLQRVSVRTTRYQAPSGNYQVNLRTMGASRTKYHYKHFDNNSCDLFFVYTINSDIWEFPSKIISNTNSLTLNEDVYGEYKIQ